MVVSLVVFVWMLSCLFAAASAVQVGAMRNERLKMQRLAWRVEMDKKQAERAREVRNKFGRRL